MASQQQVQAMLEAVRAIREKQLLGNDFIANTAIIMLSNTIRLNPDKLVEACRGFKPFIDRICHDSIKK